MYSTVTSVCLHVLLCVLGCETGNRSPYTNIGNMLQASHIASHGSGSIARTRYSSGAMPRSYTHIVMPIWNTRICINLNMDVLSCCIVVLHRLYKVRNERSQVSQGLTLLFQSAEGTAPNRSGSGTYAYCIFKHIQI